MKGRQDHNSLVKGLIDHFTRKGLEISYAKYPGYKKPFTIKRHSPDVIAYDREKNLVHIGEAKVCNELTESLTREEFEDFPKSVMTNGKLTGTNMPFVICVPNECRLKIQETYRRFEIPWSENIQVLSY